MERPILFSTEMVKAIWKDRKSKTRRLNGLKEINKNVDKWNFDSMGVILESGINRPVAWFENKITSEQIGIICPYEVGMTLWVRETWQLLPSGFDEIPPEYRYIYKATDDLSEECTRWRPAIHMPRTACRLRLKITGIRVERLRDISEEDAIKEGCITFSSKIGDGKFDDVLEFDLTAKDAFIDLWNSTIKKQDIDRCGWDTSPWVWVVSFEKVTP